MVARALTATCLVLGLACAPTSGTRDRVSAEGFGGVRVGMTVEEASNAHGSALSPAVSIADDERSCYYVFPRGAVGPVSFMIVDGRVARVDIDHPGPVTEAGVGVGSAESEVQSAYAGRIKVSPHKYTGPEGHYLTLEQGDFVIIFETNGTQVTSYRAGKLPEVAWVERCS